MVNLHVCEVYKLLRNSQRRRERVDAPAAVGCRHFQDMRAELLFSSVSITAHHFPCNSFIFLVISTPLSTKLELPQLTNCSLI
ncbi:hypothetical protein FKM82_027479 [Ascaphus truei]